jgi:hypothetical protein
MLCHPLALSTGNTQAWCRAHEVYVSLYLSVSYVTFESFQEGLDILFPVAKWFETIRNRLNTGGMFPL